MKYNEDDDGDKDASEQEETVAVFDEKKEVEYQDSRLHLNPLTLNLFLFVLKEKFDVNQRVKVIQGDLMGACGTIKAVTSELITVGNNSRVIFHHGF